MHIAASPRKMLREEVLSRGIRLNYAPKATFYTQDEAAEKVFYLYNGLVKSYLVGPEGVQKTLTYIEKGNLFGTIGIMHGKCYGAITIAVTKCSVVCFSEKQFWACFHEDNEFAEICTLSMAEICWSMGKQINSLYFLDRFGKVAMSLMYLGKRWGESVNTEVEAGGPIRLRITHQELAEFSGTSRVTVTNVLHELEACNLILKRPQEIIITDLRKLAVWVR